MEWSLLSVICRHLVLRHGWVATDRYSSVTGTLAGADDGDTYNCTASNGVSSANGVVRIRGNSNQSSTWLASA